MTRFVRRGFAVALGCSALAFGGSTSARAVEPVSVPGLPVVSSGARPGPSVLYEPPPAAPILENHDPRFRAAPLLVSGTEGHVDGEYLYQDHLYDDYGADTNLSGNAALSPRYGDIDPPTDRARYGGNGADLVELRVVPSATEVTYRLTYNTLLAADAPIAVIAFDTDRSAATGSAALTPDPGSPIPGTDQSITVWDGGGQHTAYGPSGLRTSSPLTASTDLASNQVTVSVPRTVSDPSPTATWRMTWATGLHGGDGSWLRPGQSPTATRPGGTNLRTGVTGILNVGPRFAEPYLTTDTPPDTAQAAGLRDGDLSDFATDLSWGDLAARTTRTTVPESGTQVRIFASLLDLGEGRNLGSQASPGGGVQYLGQLQPYSLYVPTAAADTEPDPFTFSLHSLNEQHWQYNGAVGILQIGEQRDSFVATPMARGNGLWYQDEGEYDTFEVWADVARHFRLDADRVAISGYSMGGYGTYRLGGLYPDLFGKAYSMVGPPAEGVWLPPLPPSGGVETSSNLWLENVRNLPYFNLVGAEDELVPYSGTSAHNVGNQAVGVRGFEQLGYRYRFRTYPAAEHLTLAAVGYDVEDAIAFLGDAAVDRDPVHVTFSHVPASDRPALGLVHDHAYWVSDVAVADGATKGTVDAFTHARGLGDPTSAMATPSAGIDPLPYDEVGRTWGVAPAIPVQNRLDVTLTDVTSTTLDLPRAALDLSDPITISLDSTTPSTVLLAGPLAEATVTGATAYRLVDDGIEVDVPAGHSDLVVTPAATDPVVPELTFPALSVLLGLAVLVVLARRRRTV